MSHRTSDWPAARCTATREQLLKRHDTTSYCPICFDNYDVQCRVANHPSDSFIRNILDIIIGLWRTVYFLFFPLPVLTRRVTLKELVTNLSCTSNLQRGASSNYLVDVDRVLNESVAVIKQQLDINPDQAGSTRREPLVYSRLSRGGKTTVITSLFDKLKDMDYLVMIISFNVSSGFDRQSNERAEHAIMRLIVTQLINQNTFSKDELLRLRCDEETLDSFLDKQSCFGTSNQKPAVLLIDELNVLDSPLSAGTSRFLQRWFLRKNRYLVFTTHIPLFLNVPSVFSATNVKTVQMPLSNDLTELRQMSGCEALTAHEATIYGGIPALIYSVKATFDIPAARFAAAMKHYQKLFPRTLATIETMSLLSSFVEEAITGSRSHADSQLRFFDQFSSIPEPDKVSWPLCYLSLILNELHSALVGSNLKIKTVVEEIVRLSSRHIPVFAGIVESGGLDWQTVVDVAILLQAIDAVLWEKDHVLISNFTVKTIQFVSMPAEYRTLKQALWFIISLVRGSPSGRLYIIRSSYAKFPLFDGFLIAVGESVKIIGYQVKLGRRTPRYAIPNWVDRGILIRGLAPGSSRNLPDGWEYKEKRSIEKLLGYSLCPLYPASWVPNIKREDMFD